MTAKEIIQLLDLVPLKQEGGMVRQTYVSARTLGSEPAATAIYYLLSGNEFSHLHRLTGDEMYHFYLGDPVELLELLPDGTSRVTVLGSDLERGQKVQHLVPAGNWQGSHLLSGKGFALLGTTMCPGYTDACYEHGNRNTLREAYPEQRDLIDALCHCPSSR